MPECQAAGLLCHAVTVNGCSNFSESVFTAAGWADIVWRTIISHFPLSVHKSNCISVECCYYY